MFFTSGESVGRVVSDRVLLGWIWTPSSCHWLFW